MSSPSRIRGAGLLLSVLALAGCLFEPPPDCVFTTCGTETGTVTAVAEDGAPAWRTTLRDAVEDGARQDAGSLPVVVGHGDHVVVDGCRAVHVLDARTGRVLHEAEDMDRMWAVTDDLVVGGRRLEWLAADDAPPITAISLTGADTSWVRLPDGAAVPRGVVAVDDGLAVLVDDEVLVLRPGGASTTVPVRTPTSRTDRSPVLLPVDGHRVAVLGEEGVVETVDTAAGAVAWTVRPSRDLGTPPARVVRLGEDLLLSWGQWTTGEVARVAPDGTVRWRGEGALADPVALGPGAAVVPLQSSQPLALDAGSGDRVFLATSPQPAQQVPVLVAGRLVAWTAQGIGVTTAWPVRDPRADPAWSRQGVVVAATEDGGVVLRTGRSEPRSLTGVGPDGAQRWSVRVAHEGAFAVAAPRLSAVVVDLPEEDRRLEECDDYPTRHTVPAGELG